METIRYQLAPSIVEDGAYIVGVFAIRNESIVGSAWGPVDQKTGVAKLDTIEVNANLRGKGIGTGLISVFREEVVKKGAKKIWGEIKPEFGLRVEQAKNFYSKNGFIVSEDDTFETEI